MPLTSSDPVNTLVISDIHLGEDLSPTATLATRLNLEIVERQLLQFLRHYTRRRENGRSWRLVINGDFVDFQSIEERNPGEFPGGSGLGRTSAAAVRGIERVVDRHPDVFRALARFLAVGNSMEVVCGNHDAELVWPEVQQAFRDGIRTAYAGLAQAKRDKAPKGEDIVSRIGFHPWFFRDGDSLWIEHGHQYDECCSFEHLLDPRSPNSEEIAVNIDAAGTRCVSNSVGGAFPRDHETWSGLGFLRFGMGLGAKGCWRLVRAYMSFDREMVRSWRAERNAAKNAEDPRRQRHEVARDHLAKRAGMSSQELVELDNFRSTPVAHSLRKLASVLMLDRIAYFTLGLLGALLCLALLDSPYNTAMAVVSLVAAGFATHRAANQRTIDAGESLELAAGKILSRVPVQYVVMGHTHEPVARSIDNDGRTYFNTGTWVPSGRPGILRAFTHLVVRQSETGAAAELCQWRDGRSRAFTPGWQPALLGAAQTVPALAGAEAVATPAQSPRR